MSTVDRAIVIVVQAKVWALLMALGLIEVAICWAVAFLVLSLRWLWTEAKR